MLAIALASAIVMGGVDTLDLPRAQNAGPREAPVGVSAPATDTVPKKRAKAVEVSDSYATRLSIHHIASYATIPLFAAQYFAGDALYNADSKGLARPDWARTVHKPLAYALGGLFAVNSVTGAWNWWETRGHAEGRTWRTIHAALMLASDAGFAYAGSIGNNAKISYVERDNHRRWAIGSMAVALTSYAMMLGPIRGDK